MKMKIALDEGSTMPTRAHEHDAGLDLYANETAYIAPHTWVAVSTGTDRKSTRLNSSHTS